VGPRGPPGDFVICVGQKIFRPPLGHCPHKEAKPIFVSKKCAVKSVEKYGPGSGADLDLIFESKF